MDIIAITLSQQAYTQIRDRIVALDLAPGSIIDESHLQEDLKLGRTPIREALLRLSQEKLVHIVPRRGIFVSELSIPHLQQIFEMRLALEPVAARLAAQRASAQQLREYEQILAGSRSSPTIQANEAFIQADQACHQLLYEASGNQLLEDTLRSLYILSLRLWRFARVEIEPLESALIPHTQILAALKNKDSDLAGSLIERHVRTFQIEIQNTMLGISPTP